MNAIATVPVADTAVIDVLRSSLYPGAKDASIAMVLAYCRAARLDPMLKPVHIVPMSVKVPGSDRYEWRDVIMPGVGHYRTQASRSGSYAGKSEPEFGPMIEREFVVPAKGDQGQARKISVRYPEWCKVSVTRMVGGQACTWTAVEYWDENYATSGRDSEAPNAMWQRRPRGQIAKVAEAQALRQAFPELLGGTHTAEEMEGKTIEGDFETVQDADQRGGQGAAKARPANAKASLDHFANADPVGDQMAGKGGQRQTEARERAPRENAPREAPQQQARQREAEAPQQQGRQSDEGQPARTTTRTRVPQMPAEADEAWVSGTKWMAGWKWLVDVLPGLPPVEAQTLVDTHADLLRAVRGYNEQRRSDVDSLLEHIGANLEDEA